MSLVILTGAGVSAESGLGTFRDQDGLWTQYDLGEVATPQGYARNPALVHEFYNARRANLLTSVPNAAHEALVKLNGRATLITQNVDDLHERAGSTNVIHMHGELMQALCASCGHRWTAPPAMTTATPCPACGQHTARPDVVWFGEMPYHMDRIENLLDQCETFVAIGTSGNVYPAAGFVEWARAAGARAVEINLEPSDVARSFDEVILGPATETVPAWVDAILSA